MTVWYVHSPHEIDINKALKIDRDGTAYILVLCAEDYQYVEALMHRWPSVVVSEMVHMKVIKYPCYAYDVPEANAALFFELTLLLGPPR